MSPSTITADTRFSLKASQFWGLLIIIGSAAAWLSAQAAITTQLRRDHNDEVVARREADAAFAQTIKEHATIMREITRELDRMK